LQAAGEESATILRMNGLLNDLIAKEVGVNDGRFLPQESRPKMIATLPPSVDGVPQRTFRHKCGSHIS
jgi:hypothetical protein